MRQATQGPADPACGALVFREQQPFPEFNSWYKKDQNTKMKTTHGACDGPVHWGPGDLCLQNCAFLGPSPVGTELVVRPVDLQAKKPLSSIFLIPKSC